MTFINCRKFGYAIMIVYAARKPMIELTLNRMGERRMLE